MNTPMSELDDLPESVRKALAYCDEIFDDADNGEWATLRAELLRLSRRVKELERESAELQALLDVLYGMKFSDRCYHALKSRAECAESELAALKAVIADGELMPEPFHDGNGNRVMLLNGDRIRALLDMGKEG